MDASRFDRFSRLFAQRRHSRRAMAQEATPEPPDEVGRDVPELLFVQTFRAGAIAPKAGTEGRYTLTLEGGHGQTVYFSDRPDRRVGASPTAQFLEHLGFPDDNPPNAALVVDDGNGSTDVAVVELFSPVYDETTGGITYEVEVLDNWEVELEVGLQEAPTDLAAIAPSFGAAHLFIDSYFDCEGGNIRCRAGDQIVGEFPEAEIDGKCSTWAVGMSKSMDPAVCIPCSTMKDVWTYYEEARLDREQRYVAQIAAEKTRLLWGSRCNERFAACNGNCEPVNYCIPNSARWVCPAGAYPIPA